MTGKQHQYRKLHSIIMVYNNPENTVVLRRSKHLGIAALSCLTILLTTDWITAPPQYLVRKERIWECFDPEELGLTQWVLPWPEEDSCNTQTPDDHSMLEDDKINQGMYVYTARFALMHETPPLDMSQWQARIHDILHLDIETSVTDESVKAVNPDMMIDVRVGSKLTEESSWVQVSHTMERRHTSCEQRNPLTYLIGDADDEVVYRCDTVFLLELGDCQQQHDYLINLRWPTEQEGIETSDRTPPIRAVHLLIISPNPAFSAAWTAKEMLMCVLTTLALGGHLLRMSCSKRPRTFSQKYLIVLGLTAVVMNLPVVFMYTYWYTRPLLVIREWTLIYMLMSVWMVIEAEHRNDNVERINHPLWRNLSFLGVLYGTLVITELCRGNSRLPGWSLMSSICDHDYYWSSLVYILVASGTGLYVGVQCVVLASSWRTDGDCQPDRTQEQQERIRVYVRATLACSTIGVIFFVLGDISRRYWVRISKGEAQFPGIFMTGVYGVLNIYVMSLLYLPNHSLAHRPECDKNGLI